MKFSFFLPIYHKKTYSKQQRNSAEIFMIISESYHRNHVFLSTLKITRKIKSGPILIYMYNGMIILQNDHFAELLTIYDENKKYIGHFWPILEFYKNIV